MPVIFITDAFIFLLVAMVIGFVFYASKHEHLRAPWREVAKRPLAMSAAVVLMIYIIIGILDSLHFHPKLDEPDKNGNVVYSTEINSVLDLLLSDLRLQTERTYSAPLAAYAFSKEMIEM
ncbi:MAG: ABC transporter permease, partial [Pseudomonadota bacterium]